MASEPAHQTPSSPHGGRSGQGNGNGSGKANGNGARPHEDVDSILHALTDLQSGLTGLKKVREETGRLEAELAGRKAELESWEKRLKSRADELESERGACVRQAKQIQDRETALAAEQHKLEEQGQQVEAQRQELAARGSRLEAHRRESEARDKELLARQQELEERSKQVVANQAALDQRAEAVAQRQEELRALGTELENQKKELEAGREELERRQQELSEHSLALDAQRKELEQKAAALQTLHGELGRARSELKGQQEEVRARSAEVERAQQEVAAARSQIEAQRAELEQEREQTQALRKAADLVRKESTDRAESVNRELAAREAELSARELELAAREKRAKQVESESTDTVSQALKKRDEAVAGAQRALDRMAALEKELDGLRSGSTTASEVANSALDHARQEAAAAAARADQAVARAAELESAVKLVRGEAKQQVDELMRQLSEATALRASLEGRLASLESELRDSGSALAETRGQLDATQGVDPEEISKRDLAIQTLKKQLDEAREWSSALEAELETAKAGAAQSGGSQAGPARPAGSRGQKWVTRRKQRLVKYKSLLQVQARKIMTAKEALAKRQMECDQVLAQRAKLAQAVETVRAQEKQIAARRARTGAAATVFYLAGAMVILGVLSWTVTSQLVPATYLAKAELRADTGGRPPAEGELAGWQQYHEELVASPGMIESAADRFAKRGIVTLGTAPELAARMKKDMAIAPGEPGSLTVELRGKGIDRTQRELDTYVTAVASVANAARANRTDGLPTIVATAAHVDRDPVEDPRPMYAIGVALGGLAATGLFGYMVWTRLSRGKHRYEEAQKVDEAMGNLAWEEAVPRRR